MLAGSLATGHAIGHSHASPEAHHGETHVGSPEAPCHEACLEDGTAALPCCHDALVHCAVDAVSPSGQAVAAASLSSAAFPPCRTEGLRLPSPEAETPPPRV